MKRHKVPIQHMLKFQFEKHQIADKYQLPCEIKSGLVEVIGITSIKYVFTTFFRLIFESPLSSNFFQTEKNGTICIQTICCI